MPSPPLVVISHAGIDTERARALKARLESAPAAREAGLKVWFDKDDLRAGEDWQKQLEDVIETRATAFVVYVGSKGILNWVDREVRLGLSRATAGGRFPFIAVISREAAGSSALPAFARQFQAVRDVENDPAEFSKLLAALLGADGAGRLRQEDEPFFGLKAIDEARSYLFFGREQETAEVLDRLDRHRIVMVIGDSGSGKSSLVNAGVVSRWRGGAMAERDGARPQDHVWHVVECRPGRDPFQSLGEAVYEAAGRLGASAEDRGTFLKWVTGDDPALRRQGLRCGLAADTRTLLVVDQFEELVAPRVDVEQRRRFATFLCDLTAADDPAFAVAMTMRRDYYNLLAAQETRPLFDFVESDAAARRYLLRRMTDAGLRRIVVEPLKLTDTAPADAELLADAVLGDVGDRAGDLALVQFALTRAWENRKDHGGNLLKSYIAIGRVDGALAREAERVYGKELGGDANESEIAATLIRLAQLSGGGGPVRRVASRREFSASRWGTLQLLASRRGNRLVFIRGDDDDDADGSVAEIAHEALLTRWPKLFAWVTAAPDDKRVLEDLTDRAAAWADAVGREKKDRQLAKSDAEREAFAGLRERRPSWLSAEEAAFVEASVEAHRQRLAVEEAARRRETRLRRFATWSAVGMAALAVLVGLGAVFLYVALERTNEALELVNRQRLEALRQRSRVLAKQAHETLQGGDMYTAARYALAGLPARPEDAPARTRDAERAVQAAGARILTRLAVAGADQLRAVGWNRDGEVVAVDKRFGIATAPARPPAPDRTVSPADLVGDRDGSGEIAALALSRQGRLAVLYAHWPKLFAVVFDADGTGRVVAELDDPDRHSVAWSGDGVCFAFGKGSAVHVWCDGAPLQELKPTGSLFAWAPQGRRLAVTSAFGAGAEIIGEAKGLTDRKSLRGLPDGNSLSALAWSSDGRQLTAATWAGARTLWTWETDGESSPRREPVSGFPDFGSTRELARSADGRLALVREPVFGPRRVANLLLWNPDDGSRVELDAPLGQSGEEGAPSVFGDGISALTWSVDGRLAASVASGPDRFVQVWQRHGGTIMSGAPLHLERREREHRSGADAAPIALAWTAEGRLAAAAAHGRDVDLWSMSARPGPGLGPSSIAVEHAHMSEGVVAAASPDGSIVVTGTGSQRGMRELQGPQRVPDVVALAPSGRHAVVVTRANRLLWMKSPGDGLQELVAAKVERRSRYDIPRVALSADGRRLALHWPNTGVFWIWDLEHAAAAPVELEMGDTGGWVAENSLAWSDDGRYFASVAPPSFGRARVRVWEWRDRAMVPVPIAEGDLRPDEAADVVVWSPGGRLAVAAGRYNLGRPVDRRLLVWASLSMPPVATVDDLTAFKRWDKLVWRGDTRLLAALTGDDPGTLVVAYEGEPLRPRRLTETKEQVLGFVGSPAGGGYGSVALAGSPGFRRFDLDRRTEVDHSDAIPEGYRILALARSGAVMLSRAGSLSLVDVDAPGPPVRLQAEQYLPEAIAVALGGERVASVNVGGTLRVWSGRGAEPRFASLSQYWDGGASVAWSPDGAHLAAGSFYSAYVLCDVSGEHPLRPVDQRQGGAAALAWSKDHRLAAGTVHVGVGDQGRLVVSVFDNCRGNDSYQALSIPWRLGNGPPPSMALSWSPDDRMLAFVVASQNEATVMAFVPEKNAEPELIELGKIDRPVPRPMLAWSADGRFIAAGAGDGAVFTWPVLAPDAMAAQVSSRLRGVELRPEEMQKAGLTSVKSSLP